MADPIQNWVPTTELSSERMDPSFYSPEFVACAERVERSPHQPLARIATKVVDHSFLQVRTDDYVEAGVPFIRVGDLGDLLLRDDNLTHISREAHLQEGNTIFGPGSILVAKTGRIAASVVPEAISECNTSQDVMGILVRDGYDPYYVTAFLGSPTGIKQQQRWVQGPVQPHLSLGNLRRQLIATPPAAIQRAIGNKLRKAERLRHLAVAACRRAEGFLADELGLSELGSASGGAPAWVTGESLQFSRIDAEYYQETYLRLDEFQAGWIARRKPALTLAQLVTRGAYGVIPSSDDYGEGDLPFLRATDLGRYVLNTHDALFVPRHYANPKATARTNDLLLEVKGELAGGAICPARADGYLLNGSIYRMTLRNSVPPHYVLAVLLSPLGERQKRRAAANSIISYLSQDFLQALWIPRLREAVETAISDDLQTHTLLSEESRQLVLDVGDSVERLLDGSLDEAKAVHDGDACERWLSTNKTLAAKGRS